MPGVCNVTSPALPACLPDLPCLCPQVGCRAREGHSPALQAGLQGEGETSRLRCPSRLPSAQLPVLTHVCDGNGGVSGGWVGVFPSVQTVCRSACLAALGVYNHLRHEPRLYCIEVHCPSCVQSCSALVEYACMALPEFVKDVRTVHLLQSQLVVAGRGQHRLEVTA